LIDFPRRTKKKKDLIISLLSCRRSKKVHCPTSLIEKLSVCLTTTGCGGGPLVNQSRNPINNVRKKDKRVQMKKHETHKTFAAACQSKENSLNCCYKAVTLADDTELYTSFQPWMSLVDDGSRDM
jgi:hypothetical protein